MDGRLSPALQTSSPARRNSSSSQALTVYSQAPRKKPNKILRSVKAAVKKFTNIIIFRSKGAKPKSTTPDTSSIHRRDVSYSASAPSTETNITSTSTLRHSESYGSSTSLNAQLGTFNFSIKDIHEATGKFSSKYEIGKGGFGIVYKGRFRDGSLVAIKRAKQSIYNPSLSKEFKNEVLTLSRIEHQNLVRLFGYLEHGDERILVLEYVGNGTLKDHLDGRMGNVLEMAERLDIAIDVAHAVTYLHTYTELTIIHRDIKPSNILITEKLKAKVSDFGLARLASEDPGATHISTQAKGTAGYMDPEYLRTYQLTEKSDVYSFGVLLVELVSGRHPIEQNRPAKERSNAEVERKGSSTGDGSVGEEKPSVDLRSRGDAKTCETVCCPNQTTETVDEAMRRGAVGNQEESSRQSSLLHASSCFCQLRR
uniref:Protein kinase domain-containing protein n=1 Tax=Kalanchoe fedtschenkoi TaxID=63787 RepID=A0A7N0UN19_KALFE